LDRAWSWRLVINPLRYVILGERGPDKPLISSAISGIKNPAGDERTLWPNTLPTPIKNGQETMTSSPCRRDLLLLAAAGVAAAPALALTSTPSLAYQGNMERALSALEAALQSLQAATPNKGGHRERAMRLIEHAMGEVQAGIDFAYQHGGGGF
jgi:hypothetical protein